MMNRRLLWAAGLVLLPLIGHAQEANPYNGTWMAHWSGHGGQRMDAEVVIRDAGGTWHVTTAVRLNNCYGRDFPIEVRRTGEAELDIKVSASQALRGCTDSRVHAKRSGDNRLDGRFADGTPITFERK